MKNDLDACITRFKEFNSIFKDIKNKKLDTIDDFKSMIKLYTHHACYPTIKAFIRKGQFEMIRTYINVCLNGLNEYGKELSYKNVAKPVYRGIGAETVNSLKDYEDGAIGFWP